MSSLGDDQDDRPACSSCRKRKLRCSRDVPTCQNCNRTGTHCIYDPKARPGLKTGAVEALNRRLAVLENILLDGQGKPLVDFTKNSTASHSDVVDNGLTASEAPAPSREPPDTRNDEQSSLSAAVQTERCSHDCERRARTSSPDLTGFASLHHDQASMLQALPPRQILVQVVNSFNATFHHWIPFLHKAKCEAQVREAQLAPELAPVLHAITAVVLPRLDTAGLCMDHAQIHRQSSTSRYFALQYAVTAATLQSLQTLLILVFEQLNDGQISQTCQLIALLVRTVDFLGLTTESGTSRSQVLMKPFNILEPTSDWTELEARRRLFWCIFNLDRYTAAQTGWNVSLTAEDVYRRLPADGGYFTREVPVQCPFFGIWNRAYASIGSSLSAHIPAQYREESPPAAPTELDSTTPTSQTSIDSSKLGAFAYAIEATESLNQVTTFFLQQRIDWQNRQHVLDWLTRFKELDLRLIHWKMFLPTRWKDSNISIDTARIDMDPNLTLAHLTHNTSMILLHYPVAVPPLQWAEVVQLPSACSIETCQMAAVEISRITEKFLRHSSIPFVNPQFSFCVYIAAKVLIAIGHKAGQTMLSEYKVLLHSLWSISANWLQLQPSAGHSARDLCLACDNSTDLAGSYARHLEQLARASPERPFDFFDHTGTSCTTAVRRPSSALTSPTADRTPQDKDTGSVSFSAEAAAASDLLRPSRKKRRQANPAAVSKWTNRSNHPRRPRNIPGSADSMEINSSTSPDAAVHQSYRHSRNSLSFHDIAPNNDTVGPGEYPGQEVPSLQAVTPNLPQQVSHQYAESNTFAVHDGTWPQDALFNLSDALMQPQFLQQDRIITFEDMYFRMDGMDWS